MVQRKFGVDWRHHAKRSVVAAFSLDFAARFFVTSVLLFILFFLFVVVVFRERF